MPKVRIRAYSSKTPIKTWQCVNVNYPLPKILELFSIYDFLRGVVDTISTIAVVLYLLDTNREDVHFTKLRTGAEGSDYEKYEAFYFLRNRNIMIGIFIACVGTAFLEVPLAVVLNKATKSINVRILTIWMTASGLVLILSVILFIAILVYANKAELIRDDLASSGHLSQLMIYNSIFRAAWYDISKIAEMRFVAAYLRLIHKSKANKSILGLA
ncbi:hypothetical protein Ocin01_13182 [Orchesella cincta]|uniref:Uncharacterized protein n=1 Tax=Orchesella cincta TaxID=48709 RepID=A0A1D2MKR7_ORCCI|nr:hypothetical protein Ocin01_13182 [Orchesella cincta]